MNEHTNRAVARSTEGNAMNTKRTALAVAMLAITAQANALELYAGFGESNFHLRGSGAWYVDELDEVVHNDAAAQVLGVRGEVLPWLDLSLGYINFGAATTNSEAYYPDAAYEKGAPKGCAKLGCAPINKYVGRFAVYGVEAFAEPKLRLSDWTLSVGVGAAYLKHRYRMKVYMGEGNNPYTSDPNQKERTWNSDDHPEFFKNDKWRLAPALSVRVQHKGFFARYSYYEGRDEAAIFKSLGATFVGYSFPLK